MAALGPGVPDLKVGDRVATGRDVGRRRPGPYAQSVVRRAAEALIRVPSGLFPEVAAPIELGMRVRTRLPIPRQVDAVHDRRFALARLAVPRPAAAADRMASESPTLCRYCPPVTPPGWGGRSARPSGRCSP